MNKIKILLIIIAILCLILGGIIAFSQIPIPVGVAGKIEINGSPIENNHVVYIKNEDTGEIITVNTSNGYYVGAVSGSNGHKINVSFIYNNVLYSNYTFVNLSLPTQWINFSIKDNLTPLPPYENKNPVIIIEDITGYTNEEIILNASLCFDPDGYITKYEWTIFSYPPFTLTGKVVKTVFKNPCDIIGILKVYDNSSGISSKTFKITIYEKEENISYSQNNEINITLPPIANFSYEYFIENDELKVILFDTSYDVDGYIVNRTWNIDGKIFYDKNVSVSYNINNITEINVSLLVKDNDGIFNMIKKNIRIEIEGNETIEKYNLSIKFNGNVILEIEKDNKTIVRDEGNEFNFIFEKGSYKIKYFSLYTSKSYEELIELDRDMEVIRNIKEENKKIPSFEILYILIAILIIFKKVKNEGKSN